MLKRMSVVICGLAVMLMTAGVASAQSETQEAKAKVKAAAKKTGEATENAAVKTGEATKKAAKKTVAVLTDAEITTAVKTKLVADSKVGAMGINVDTSDHVVTLNGTVHSAAERAEAVRVAKKTAGVHKVVNKLTIEPKK